MYERKRKSRQYEIFAILSFRQGKIMIKTIEAKDLINFVFRPDNMIVAFI